MYDILVVGAGPAGITAGIYAKRAGKKVAIIEKLVPGGQVALIGEIENYPGFKKINGDELSMNLYSHALDLGMEFIFDEAISFKLKNKKKEVICKKGTYEAKSVILALGSASKELDCEGEKEFFGKGVSYCAICDGNFFKGKNVAVVGSGDSSISNALYLSGLCKTVHVFTKDNLKLNTYSEKDLKKANIILHKGAVVTKICGKNKVEELEFSEKEKINRCSVEAVFVAIGRLPDTSSLKGVLELDSKGYIVTTDNVKTSIDGVYACGDVVNPPIKQIVTATALGAIAATEAIKFVAK